MPKSLTPESTISNSCSCKSILILSGAKSSVALSNSIYHTFGENVQTVLLSFLTAHVTHTVPAGCTFVKVTEETPVEWYLS